MAKTSSFVPDQIHVSSSQQRELTEMADAIIAETLHVYEHFVAHDRVLPLHAWKLTKSRENVRVYRARKLSTASKTHEIRRPRFLTFNDLEQHVHSCAYMNCTQDNTTFSRTVTDILKECTYNGLAKTKPAHVPWLVAIGQIEGTVDDVAYGCLAHTLSGWTERNAYVHNEAFVERKILARLHVPQAADPFRSETLKWGIADFGPLICNRDVLYLESQGMALDSDGERIFYYLVHSVELQECPPLDARHQIRRVQVSVAYISRQLNQNTVELFGRGFADPRRDLIKKFGLMVLASNITASAQIVECALIKKLRYLLLLPHKEEKTLHANDCGVCGKKTSQSRFRSVTVCPICRRVTCSKCSVVKQLTVQGTARTTFAFCLSCVVYAKKLSAWQVACFETK